MSEEIKNTEIEESCYEDFEVKEVKPSFISKFGSVIKKNGKKIAVSAAIGIGMITAYAFGKRSGNESEIIDDEYEEIDKVEEISNEESTTE